MSVSRARIKQMTLEQALSAFEAFEGDARRCAAAASKSAAERFAMDGDLDALSEWFSGQFGDKPRKFAPRDRNPASVAASVTEKAIETRLRVVLRDFAEEHLNPRIGDFLRWFEDRFGKKVPRDELRGIPPEEAADKMSAIAEKAYDALMASEGPRYVRSLERYILMEVIDSKWKDHLYAMDHLKEGIGLRGYAQVDPKIEYKKEGYRMFGEMMDLISSEVTDHFFRVRLTREAEEALGSRWKASDYIHQDYSGTRSQMDQAAGRDMSGEKPKPIRRDSKKVGRNEPCPCGSGKKYKKCCGQ